MSSEHSAILWVLARSQHWNLRQRERNAEFQELHAAIFSQRNSAQPWHPKRWIPVILLTFLLLTYSWMDFVSGVTDGKNKKIKTEPWTQEYVLLVTQMIWFLPIFLKTAPQSRFTLRKIWKWREPPKWQTLPTDACPARKHGFGAGSEQQLWCLSANITQNHNSFRHWPVLVLEPILVQHQCWHVPVFGDSRCVVFEHHDTHHRDFAALKGTCVCFTLFQFGEGLCFQTEGHLFRAFFFLSLFCFFGFLSPLYCAAFLLFCFLFFCFSALLLICFSVFFPSTLLCCFCFSAFLLFYFSVFFAFLFFCFSVFFVCFPFFASLYLLLLFGFCFYESFMAFPFVCFSVVFLFLCFCSILCIVFVLLSLLFVFLLASLLFCLISRSATTTWRTPPAAQTTRAANTKGKNKCNKSNKNNKNSKRKKNTTMAKKEHNQSCLWMSLCSLGGRCCALQRLPPCPPPAVFFCCCVLSFLLVLVSLRWCKDDDVNELVNKSRFHNASIITQHGKSPCKNARLKFKNAAQIIFNILQIPCNMKGSIFHMSQMPCKIRGSISTIQVDVAEWWTSGKYLANSVLCFFAFLALIVSQVSSWFCKALQQQQQQ